MNEVWMEIIGSDGKYKISNLGNVFSNISNRLLKKYVNTHGYETVAVLYKGVYKQIKVHRLVINHFIRENIEGMDINHINGIKTDNRVENLEWCTRSENMKHAYDILGVKRNYLNFIKNKSVIMYSDDNDIIKEYDSIKVASEITGISKTHISQICRGRGKTAGGFHWKFS